MANSRLEEIRKVRIDKLTKLRNLGIDPYPSKYSRDFISIRHARSLHGQEVSVVGRILRLREHGNVIFMDIKDSSDRVQLLFQKSKLDSKFTNIKLLDIGDFLGVSGVIVTTQAGEITLDVGDYELLSKSIRPLPDNWQGIKDEETRYRLRYIDLLQNDSLKELFYKKSKFWNSVRTFMISKGFLEVETPVLENTAGGADANPFVTHHDALDIDLFLRISMGELWQKRLMVAGFDKTFEIGRQFRNEGISREHLQDYTQMEFYWAYASYFESMQLVEELYKHIAQETFGTLEFEIAGHKVDLSAPWERIDFTQTIKQNLGIDISVATNEEVKQKLTNLHIDFDPKDERGRLLDLLWKHVRKSVSGPAFLVGHPVEVSPLAKRQKNNPNFVERYQVILAGSENGNGYSELNDPVDQQQRFEAQQAMREAGDTEAQMDDSDFVAALEYGMPPVSGFGVSERLFSFLANQPIRECVLFPLLRPETTANTSKFIQDFDQKLVIVINPSLPNWQIMNTSGHIAAFLGNKMSAKFDTGSHFVTKDGTALPRNTQYPIVTLSATAAELKSLMSDVRNTNLLHIGYTSEMMETTDDKKISELIGSKTDDQVTFAGVGIFGSKHEIDTLTKKFPLWK